MYDDDDDDDDDDNDDFVAIALMLLSSITNILNLKISQFFFLISMQINFRHAIIDRKTKQKKKKTHGWRTDRQNA